jgi:3-oxoacyl-[acyl-carrier protein] reductase
MPSYELKGRTALVTGGASGIGLATAESLAHGGARVAINFLPGDPRGPEQVNRLRQAGLSVMETPGDVAIAREAEAMVASAIKGLGGRLDILVNNAGTPGVREPVEWSRLDLITEELWQHVISVNLLGLFRCTKAAAEALRVSRGSVVNLASVAGLRPRGSSMAYGATKAGVINLTKNLARALAPEVRVNAVAPGTVDSPWTEAWPEERKQTSAETALLKRLCTPEDIAEVIVFLACAGGMVTGQTIVVDGGLTL